MGVIINGGTNIGSGGILITSPYIEPPYTGSICVSGSSIPGVNGTYTFFQYYTQNGFTRPEYYFNQFSISVLYTAEGRYGLLDGTGDDTLLYEGLTFPPPLNPYLETSWSSIGFGPESITVTIGPC
jgi:hypothetical protein